MQTLTSNEIEAGNISRQKQFCTFRLAERLFGVDILHVKEINRELDFMPVYHAPEEVKGYVNIRGQIHLVLDLRLLLGLETKKLDNNSCMVIFKQQIAEPFGVLVDKIGDVVNVSEDTIEEKFKLDDSITSNSDYIANSGNLVDGVCKLKDNLLVILNAKKFLSAIKF